MINTYSYLTPSINNIKLEPKIVQLYVPPIKWKGDPIGHIGKNDALFFVASGECCFIVEDVSFVALEGQLVFLPRGKMRSYTTVNEERLKLYEMNFVAEIDEKYWYDAVGFKKNIYAIAPERPSEIQRLFEESVHYEMNKSISYDFALCSNIMQVLKEYISVRLSLESKAQPFDDVIKFMHSNMQRQLKIEELAALSFMQPTYFIKKFKSAVGESPIVYLNKLRIYRAIYLLASTNDTLSDIAKSVGIFDSSYFSRMFKAYSNTTPSEYRALFEKQSYSYEK
jgi:AraC-like DNA-binding protein